MMVYLLSTKHGTSSSSFHRTEKSSLTLSPSNSSFSPLLTPDAQKRTVLQVASILSTQCGLFLKTNAVPIISGFLICKDLIPNKTSPSWIDKPMTVIHMHSRILLTQNHPMNKQPQTNNLYSTVSARTAHPLGNLETSSTEDRDSDGDWSLPSIPLPRKQHGCLVHLSDRLLPYNTLVTC